VRSGTSEDTMYDPELPSPIPNLPVSYFWDFAGDTVRVIGYALTLPNNSSINPTNWNYTSIPQPIPTGGPGGGEYPTPSSSERPLAACATLSANGENSTAPATIAGYNFTHIITGVYQPHRTSHLTGNLPTGGNVAMLDGHTEWRKFDKMLPRVAGGVPATTPTFWW
jgi:prepilin-type processing-associated H-X9-DG protein